MIARRLDGDYPRIEHVPAITFCRRGHQIIKGSICPRCLRRKRVNFISRLFGLGRDQFSPIVVRAARVGLSVGGSAAIGAVLEGLGAVDWSAYLSDSQVPYALLIAGALAMVLEGLADQLKRRGSW